MMGVFFFRANEVVQERRALSSTFLFLSDNDCVADLWCHSKLHIQQMGGTSIIIPTNFQIQYQVKTSLLCLYAMFLSVNFTEPLPPCISHVHFQEGLNYNFLQSYCTQFHLGLCTSEFDNVIFYNIQGL